MVKNLPAMGRPRFHPWVGKIPWRREWPPTPVFLPGEFHGQKSLVGYSPRGHKELDTTESLTFSLSTKTFKEFFFFFLKKTLLRLGQVKGWWYMNISFISRIFGLKMNQRVSLLFIFVFCQISFLNACSGVWQDYDLGSPSMASVCCHKRMDWEIKNQVWRDKG